MLGADAFNVSADGATNGRRELQSNSITTHLPVAPYLTPNDIGGTSLYVQLPAGLTFNAAVLRYLGHST